MNSQNTTLQLARIDTSKPPSWPLHTSHILSGFETSLASWNMAESFIHLWMDMLHTQKTTCPLKRDRFERNVLFLLINFKVFTERDLGIYLEAQPQTNQHWTVSDTATREKGNNSILVSVPPNLPARHAPYSLFFRYSEVIYQWVYPWKNGGKGNLTYFPPRKKNPKTRKISRD